MTLGDAKVGSTVVVTKIEGDGAYKRRIMDMGITKGSELYIRKVAPLGDPVEITVRGYELTVSGTSYENYSTVTLTDSSDHKYFFDNNGRLVKIADMNLSCVKESNVTSFSSEEINGIINISYS